MNIPGFRPTAMIFSFCTYLYWF